MQRIFDELYNVFYNNVIVPILTIACTMAILFTIVKVLS